MKHEEIFKRTKDTNKAKEFFLNKLAYTVGPERLKKAMEEYFEMINIFDVRDYEDYIKGHIPYAMHIPMDQFEDQLLQFSKEKINVIYSYCPLCQRAQKTAYLLADKGYPTMVLIGGFKGWKKRDLEIVETDSPNY